MDEHQFVEDVRAAFNAAGVPWKHMQVFMSAYKAWGQYSVNPPSGVTHTLQTYNAGLGTPGHFPEKWFSPKHGMRLPRQKQWWLLTEEGAKIMDTVTEKHPWPADKGSAGMVAFLIHSTRLP